jgi:hypothetical protein
MESASAILSRLLAFVHHCHHCRQTLRRIPATPMSSDDPFHGIRPAPRPAGPEYTRGEQMRHRAPSP